jgi:hypothetical protein
MSEATLLRYHAWGKNGFEEEDDDHAFTGGVINPALVVGPEDVSKFFSLCNSFSMLSGRNYIKRSMTG